MLSAMADKPAARSRLILEGIIHPGEIDRFTVGAVPTAPDQLAGLRLRVLTYFARIETLAAKRAVVDVDAARKVADTLSRLLDEPDVYSDQQRELLRGAVEYFVLDRDNRADLTDAIGFDDDARVVNALLDVLGRADLVINL